MRSKDNRRAPRKRHNSVIEVFDGSGKVIAWTGKLVDCSETGACFSTVRNLADGERLQARLRLLDRGVLDISAHVIWRRKGLRDSNYGIKFDSVQSVPQAGE
jgi:hypothetical protein